MREIVLDTETTGLDPNFGHRIIEIGCVELINRRKTGKVFHTYINPERDVPYSAYAIHGISTEYLFDKPVFADIARDFFNFIADSTLVIHNAQFDVKFINHEFTQINLPLVNHSKVIDTLLMARKKFPGSPASLDALCKKFNIDLSSREKHGALLDAELLSLVYLELHGGAQNSLNFSSISKSNIMNSRKTIERKVRKFDISEQELIDHQEFLKKIKNPIWSS